MNAHTPTIVFCGSCHLTTLTAVEPKGRREDVGRRGSGNIHTMLTGGVHSYLSPTIVENHGQKYASDAIYSIRQVSFRSFQLLVGRENAIELWHHGRPPVTGKKWF